MADLPLLAAVCIAILLGAMSPGPSFIVVARSAIANSRTHGVAVALGMGVGGALFAIAALLGLQVLLATVPSLYRALQIIGALYLLVIAYKLWKSAPKPLVIDGGASEKSTTVRAFAIGLSTQLSNPKTAIVYATVFSAALPDAPSAFMLAIFAAAIFSIEFGWYAVVAVAFSAERARRLYVRGKCWIDRLAAGAMGLLGAKILNEVRVN